MATTAGKNSQCPYRAMTWFNKINAIPTMIALPPMLPRVITMAITPAIVHAPPMYDSMGSTPPPAIEETAAAA